MAVGSRVLLLVSLITLLPQVHCSSMSPKRVCAGGATMHGAHCACPPDRPICVGSRCTQGRSRKSNERVHGFRIECTDCACISTSAASETPVDQAGEVPAEATHEVSGTSERPQAPRVLIMTVATHREPFIDLLERSVSKLGADLYIAGQNEIFYGT